MADDDLNQAGATPEEGTAESKPEPASPPATKKAVRKRTPKKKVASKKTVASKKKAAPKKKAVRKRGTAARKTAPVETAPLAAIPETPATAPENATVPESREIPAIQTPEPLQSAPADIAEEQTIPGENTVVDSIGEPQDSSPTNTPTRNENVQKRLEEMGVMPSNSTETQNTHTPDTKSKGLSFWQKSFIFAIVIVAGLLYIRSISNNGQEGDEQVTSVDETAAITGTTQADQVHDDTESAPSDASGSGQQMTDSTDNAVTTETRSTATDIAPIGNTIVSEATTEDSQEITADPTQGEMTQTGEEGAEIATDPTSTIAGESTATESSDKGTASTASVADESTIVESLSSSMAADAPNSALPTITDAAPITNSVSGIPPADRAEETEPPVSEENPAPTTPEITVDTSQSGGPDDITPTVPAASGDGIASNTDSTEVPSGEQSVTQPLAGQGILSGRAYPGGMMRRHRALPPAQFPYRMPAPRRTPGQFQSYPGGYPWFLNQPVNPYYYWTYPPRPPVYGPAIRYPYIQPQVPAR